MSASASNILKRQRATARLSSSFLLLSLLLLLAGPRIENPRCRNPSVFLLGAVHAFAPRSTIHEPSSYKHADDGGIHQRHPQWHRHQMAKLGKIAEEYSSWDGNGNNNNGPSPGSSSSSSITTADATTEREIRRLRTDIAKTDARLQNLRKESAKMDAARAAASASSTSTSTSTSTSVSSRDTPSSALGIAFRTVLAPLAALGAGRAYLRQRAEVREEVARAEADLRAQRADLAARREELERVERFPGVSALEGLS